MGLRALVRPSVVQPQSVSGLASELGLDRHGPDLSVTGISLHTDLVAPGDLFVAMPGAQRHGVEFWATARDAGARALLTDLEGYESLRGHDIPVLVASFPREHLGALASRIYHTHNRPLPSMFGVTGTNGKTSTAFMLDALMRSLGWVTALSTTAERRVADDTYASTLTTPEAPDIHAMVALALERGVRGISLEISAQALDKNRLDGVVVDVAGFTNLSHDHFEDFGGMDRYLEAKAQLFTPQHARSGVVCVDTTWGQKLYANSAISALRIAGEDGPDAGYAQGRRNEPVGIVAIGAADPEADWRYSVLEAHSASTVFRVTSPDGTSADLWAPIIGTHMVSNAALAVAMLVAHGVSLDEIGAANGPGSPGIPVYLPGRMERVSGSRGPQIFVDAGHTEDAYTVTLNAVRPRTQGSLVMVCGTSGNRDPGKRPRMGAIAAQLADVVIVTDTSPRGEDPANVRRGLLEGARGVSGSVVHEVADPKDAIRLAVSLAGEGDTVLWMGQGSQPYRDLGSKKIPFQALAEAQAALREAGWATEKVSDV